MKPLPPLLAAALSLSLPLAAAPNWPQWRGPEGDSLAGEGDYPTRFSPTEGVLWKVALPGRGSSTPAVWGDRLFVTCGIDGQDGVVAYDWSGEEAWRRTLGPGRVGKHRNGSGSNPSPITDGERVVVYYKSGTLASLGLDGDLQWQVNLQEKFGEDTLWWDLGTSPVFAGGKIVVAVMQEGESYLVALDPISGEVAWKTDRTFPVQKESGQAYTTPQVVEVEGRETLVVWGADHLTGHDPVDGRTLWTCGGFNPEDKAMWRVIASPAIVDGIAVVPYGRAEFTAGVKLGGEGDVTATARLWERKGLGADCPSPVGREGRVYLLSDRGALHCLEVKTGKTIWKDAIPRAKSNYFSSPVLAGDLLYAAREDGVVAVVRISESGMELVSQNNMGELLTAAPVLVRDRLFLRGVSQLFCLGAK